jgi:16S rRNA (cytosine967-C5)-methyltransferase
MKSKAPPRRGSSNGGPRSKPGPRSARALAVSVLARVAATDAYLNVVLDGVLDEFQPADPRDAALVTELCYGATRQRLALDFALSGVSERRLETLEDRVLAALRLGVYQLYFTRVPPHAAVSDTVQALKEVGLERAAGFVNAVLRKVAQKPSLPLPETSSRAELLSIRESHPTWLVERWMAQFGPERAEAMLVADNRAPPVVLRTNSAKLTRDELLAHFREVGVKASATALSPLGLVLESPGRVEDVFGFGEGFWQVQDEAAQLVGVFAQVPAAARVLDACAAPGGKACHLAQTNRVLAMDFHANKLPKIQAEARRLGLVERLATRHHDSRKALPKDLGEFDAVFVDAPCSGLGTLRRHPELRYTRVQADIAGLAALQRELLETCQAVVVPGGLLVYSVCTTEPAEGVDQVDLFLRSHPDFTAEPPVGLAQLPTWQGHLRTLPGPEGLDGFFAARLRRTY